MKTDVTTTISAGNDHRLTRYCAAGAASVAAFAGAVTTADAAVVFVNYNNQVLTDTTLGDTTFTLYSFDLDGNGTQDFRLGVRSGDGATLGGANFLCPLNGTNGVIGISSSGYNYGGKLAKGVNVGTGGAFLTLSGTGFGARASLASGTGFPNSQWLAPSPANGYLGIRFTGVNGLEYGWIHISVAGTTVAGAERQITLIGAGYQSTANTAILTGAGEVPEPSTVATLGLAALGAAGLAINRRRAAARQAA